MFFEIMFQRKKKYFSKQIMFCEFSFKKSNIYIYIYNITFYFLLTFPLYIFYLETNLTEKECKIKIQF